MPTEYTVLPSTRDAVNAFPRLEPSALYDTCTQPESGMPGV